MLEAIYCLCFAPLNKFVSFAPDVLNHMQAVGTYAGDTSGYMLVPGWMQAEGTECVVPYDWTQQKVQWPYGFAFLSLCKM